jgi:hypothetical protein
MDFFFERDGFARSTRQTAKRASDIDAAVTATIYYGYASWQKLKQLVDELAVNLHLGERQHRLLKREESSIAVEIIPSYCARQLLLKSHGAWRHPFLGSDFERKT